MTTSRPLRIALAGCGAVSKLYYAPALKQLESLGQVRVSALFDPNSANLTQFKTLFPGAMAVQDFDELTRMGLDLAIVASPPQYHVGQTVRLLQAGLSVLCEKPMALSVAEGETMVAAAFEAQRLLAIGLVRRFLPAARTIHYMLSQNVFGNVKSFTFYEGRVFRWPVQSASYFHQNGVLRDIGVHVLDLLIWWWGEPEEIVYEDDAMGGVEVNCRIRLRFRQSFTGEVILSREFELPNSCTIQCENGSINWAIDEPNQVQIGFPNLNYSLSGQLHDTGNVKKYPMLPGPVAADFHESFVNQLKNVLAAIHGTEPLAVPGHEGLSSLKAIDHCYSHRMLMDMPWLGERELLHAYQVRGMHQG